MSYMFSYTVEGDGKGHGIPVRNAAIYREKVKKRLSIQSRPGGSFPPAQEKTGIPRGTGWGTFRLFLALLTLFVLVNSGSGRIGITSNRLYFRIDGKVRADSLAPA